MSLNKKIQAVEADKERAEALYLNVKKKSKGKNCPKSPIPGRKSYSPSPIIAKKGPNQGRRRGGVGTMNKGKDDETLSLAMAKSILMKEFHRKNDMRIKSKLAARRTNDKLEALYRFRKFSTPFLNPEKEEEKRKEKEKAKAALKSVPEEVSKSASTPNPSRKPNSKKTKEGNSPDSKEGNELEENHTTISTQRKTQIVRKVSTKSSKDVLQEFKERQKRQGSAKNVKSKGDSYSKFNQNQSTEQQKQMEEMIQETTMNTLDQLMG